MTKRQWIKKLYDKVEQADKEWTDIVGLTYTVFTNAPEVLKVTKEDEGKRIWVAGNYKTKKAKIRKFNNKDNIEVTFSGSKKYRTLTSKELLLHPNQVTKERLEQYDYTIKDGRKS